MTDANLHLKQFLLTIDIFDLSEPISDFFSEMNFKEQW